MKRDWLLVLAGAFFVAAAWGIPIAVGFLVIGVLVNSFMSGFREPRSLPPAQQSAQPELQDHQPQNSRS